MNTAPEWMVYWGFGLSIVSTIVSVLSAGARIFSEVAKALDGKQRAHHARVERLAAHAFADAVRGQQRNLSESMVAEKVRQHWRSARAGEELERARKVARRMLGEERFATTVEAGADAEEVRQALLRMPAVSTVEVVEGKLHLRLRVDE